MFQQTIIVGRLGSDPNMRYTPTGQAVTSFSVATDRQYTDQAGKSVKETVWFKVSAWGKLAETCNNYLQKGKLVLVEGRLSEPKPWKDLNNEYHASLEMTAQTVKFLSEKEAESEDIPF